MKLGLFGYGKMGKAIEQIAEKQGIEIVWRIRREDTPTPTLLRQADVAIEFTRPEVAFDNVMLGKFQKSDFGVCGKVLPVEYHQI